MCIYFLEGRHMLGSLGIELRPIKVHMDNIYQHIVRQLASSPPDAKLVEINIGGYPVTLDLGCIIIGSVIISEENLSHFLNQESRRKVVELYKNAFARPILQHWRGVNTMDDITVKFSAEDIQRAKEYFQLGKPFCVCPGRSTETYLLWP